MSKDAKESNNSKYNYIVFIYTDYRKDVGLYLLGSYDDISLAINYAKMYSSAKINKTSATAEYVSIKGNVFDAPFMSLEHEDDPNELMYKNTKKILKSLNIKFDGFSPNRIGVSAVEKNKDLLTEFTFAFAYSEVEKDKKYTEESDQSESEPDVKGEPEVVPVQAQAQMQMQSQVQEQMLAQMLANSGSRPPTRPAQYFEKEGRMR